MSISHLCPLPLSPSISEPQISSVCTPIQRKVAFWENGSPLHPSRSIQRVPSYLLHPARKRPQPNTFPTGPFVPLAESKKHWSLSLLISLSSPFCQPLRSIHSSPTRKVIFGLKIHLNVAPSSRTFHAPTSLHPRFRNSSVAIDNLLFVPDFFPKRRLCLLL